MTTDPFTLTAAAAINQLVALLAEARTYLDQGEALAAIGTLVMFDDHAEDVRAAIRTLQMAQRRRR
jgi:stage V sporulation protein SpoVS